MLRTIAFSSVFAVFAALAACSSSSSDAPAAADAGNDAKAGVETGSSVPKDPNNCIPPGTKPNEQGIGGYCEPDGHQCDTAGPGGQARLCSADFEAPAHAWFCTFLCNSDADCGSGAKCISDTRGKGCVPQVKACLDLQSKTGGDAGADTSTPDTSTPDTGSATDAAAD